MGVLRIMGAEPQPDERIVRSGRLLQLLACRQVSIWGFGWPVRSSARSRRKQFSWSSNTTPIHHTTLAR